MECCNKDSIHLHKDGLFWRAYEVSAYHFVSHIKEYRPIKKYYKVVQGDVVYIGFPASVKEDVKDICIEKRYNLEYLSDKHMVILTNFETSGFISWKDSILIQHKNVSPLQIQNNNTGKSILTEIATYPLALKTPMEAQQFLHDIQKRIDGYV